MATVVFYNEFMHIGSAWLGMELDVKQGTAKLSDENLLFLYFSPSTRAVFQQQSREGLAPVLEDNVGTGPHSTFCLCRMDDVSGQIHSIDACRMVGAMECYRKSSMKPCKPLLRMEWCQVKIRTASKTSQGSKNVANDALHVAKPTLRIPNGTRLTGSW
ncbi:hypothetical protein HELRODRAFT_178780 [Helobdella robusta]|uniref:Uncharacterized protein n=1 Tax=Helobdella robusta TaxID=6412 RepID=T1FDQ4_HELRO|nr:hypothetical protein HELRODRAFT_178780 [Helobdella robusta]ESN96975.1 hypothetical protein HELRODRAFT_178780 [Helobdella robusta]